MTALSQTLLLVEDNEDDVFLMRRALAKAGCSLPLQVSCDGQQAINYLQGNGDFHDRSRYPLPVLIFLDLKLPYVHGFEVLEWIRSQAGLKGIPVVVLTSSSEDRDRKKAFDLGAREYFVKPPEIDAIRQALEMIGAGKPAVSAA